MRRWERPIRAARGACIFRDFYAPTGWAIFVSPDVMALDFCLRCGYALPVAGYSCRHCHALPRQEPPPGGKLDSRVVMSRIMAGVVALFLFAAVFGGRSRASLADAHKHGRYGVAATRTLTRE